MKDLPSIEEPSPGTICPNCGEELRIENWCAPCFEESLQVREQVVQADLDEARSRARTWQVNRAVQS